MKSVSVLEMAYLSQHVYKSWQRLPNYLRRGNWFITKNFLKVPSLDIGHYFAGLVL